MARRVFFSFHYQRDVWRVNQIRSIPNITGTAAAGFQDASLWEETKRRSGAAIKGLIDRALNNTTVTVVCIGAQTAGRTYINYEIDESIKRGNGIVGVQIHHLQDHNRHTDPAGYTPTKLTNGGFKIYKYVDVTRLATWIEAAARDAGK